ncbi:DUF2637 domain-containing protein [Streptomyces sp. SL13]|uniref:DUF2637 domain-containing protein n=1 Tax=Streptantibioticus silvisoli TaxID=2705255 RepID=A0AA90JZP9_9ACTN|nr:DUF2637 domain-containing protein [Streptantibioticus silvisoli]MDI5972251.1 DUF2637 domain-containing protein [Streptantibioticus silvisoli]
MSAIRMGRTQRILVGLVVAGAVVIAGIGFAGSYAAVRTLALHKGFGWFSNVFPIGVDAGIVVLLSLDLLLTWLRIPFPLLRQTAWLLTAATIAFNGAAAWPDPLGVGMHAVIPVLFVVSVEAARHAVGRIADITADRHMESVRIARWLLAFPSTFRLWRRMKLWELRSYDQVIRLEQDRLVYQARLRARYGRAWRRRAPVESLMPLRLAKYGVPLAETGPAGLLAAGITPDTPTPVAPAADAAAQDAPRKALTAAESVPQDGAPQPESAAPAPGTPVTGTPDDGTAAAPTQAPDAQGQAPQGQAPQDLAAQGFAPQGQAPQGQPQQGQPQQGFVPQGQPQTAPPQAQALPQAQAQPLSQSQPLTQSPAGPQTPAGYPVQQPQAAAPRAAQPAPQPAPGRTKGVQLPPWYTEPVEDGAPGTASAWPEPPAAPAPAPIPKPRNRRRPIAVPPEPPAEPETPYVPDGIDLEEALVGAFNTFTQMHGEPPTVRQFGAFLVDSFGISNGNGGTLSEQYLRPRLHDLIEQRRLEEVN